jgi:hypothetical protein
VAPGRLYCRAARRAAVGWTPHRVDAPLGFAAMIAYMSSNGPRTVLVESASRFSRDLIVQQSDHGYYLKMGFYTDHDTVVA